MVTTTTDPLTGQDSTSTSTDPLTGNATSVNPLTGSLNTSSTTPAQSSTSQTASSTGYASGAVPTQVSQTPTNVTVDPSKQTVQGQLTGILASNSPLMQQATASANETSNSRGLLNSSMAVGAAQNAVISNALPIAQSDSSTYNSVSGQNAQAANTLNLANLDSATKQSLADVQANYNIIMQANSSAGQLYQQAVKNITDITNSTSMDAASKQAAISQQMNMLGSGMKIFGAMDNMNLGSLLDFNTNGTSGTQSNATPASSGTTSSTPPATTAAASYSGTSAPSGFPTNPTQGQVYSYNGTLYQYTGGNTLNSTAGMFSGLTIPGIGGSGAATGTWTKI